MEGFMNQPGAQPMAPQQPTRPEGAAGSPIGSGQEQPVIEAPVPGGKGNTQSVRVDPQVVKLLGVDFFTDLNSQNVDRIMNALQTRLQGIAALKEKYMAARQQQAPQGGQPQQGMVQQPQGQPAQSAQPSMSAPDMPTSVPSQPAMPNRNEHPFADQKHQGFVNGGPVKRRY